MEGRNPGCELRQSPFETTDRGKASTEWRLTACGSHSDTWVEALLDVRFVGEYELAERMCEEKKLISVVRSQQLWWKTEMSTSWHQPLFMCALNQMCTSVLISEQNVRDIFTDSGNVIWTFNFHCAVTREFRNETFTAGISVLKHLRKQFQIKLSSSKLYKECISSVSPVQYST